MQSTPLSLEDDGFTLIEVLIASVVLVVGMLGVLALVDTANGVTSKTLAREGATTLARDMLERARQVPFDSQGASTFAASVRVALPDAGSATVVDSSTFTLVRRNVKYTVAISACKVDDSSDGVGVHDATFCDFADPPQGTPPPGAPTGSAVTLKLLGIPIAVPVGGALIDSTVCGLLGANPIGSIPLLDSLLGRGGAVNSILGLINSGADVGLCPSTATGEQFALDRTPADFSKVVTSVKWPDGGSTRSLTQSTLIANPGGV